jgi:Transglutaminase-like superfamily
MKLKTMQRLHLREAAMFLILARLAVRFLPAAWILAWARRPPRHVNRFAVQQVAGWVPWAVETMAAKPWMQAACLPRALAAQAMLRRRGVASRLCLGVAREGAGLSAHAWLELGQDWIIVGEAQAPLFKRLVEFGGERA